VKDEEASAASKPGYAGRYFLDTEAVAHMHGRFLERLPAPRSYRL
jgi:hypothetical protein